MLLSFVWFRLTFTVALWVHILMTIHLYLCLAPVCGPCEIQREKRGSKCCPEYECGMWCITSLFLMQTQFYRRNNAFSFYGSLVCDLVNCDLPEVPRCEDGQIVVLKNPGECQPIHECGMTFRHSL